MTSVGAVPRENFIEAVTRSWERINSIDRCPRCSGFMVTEWSGDPDNTGQRCVQCGELIDPVILQNRRLQFRSAFSPGQK
ncbi:MAG: hypothetical protein ACT4OO_07480 [Nitrospiraceae bacterium]